MHDHQAERGGCVNGIELVLNGANLNFVAFSSPQLEGSVRGLGLDGQFIAIFIMVLACRPRAAVALAIALSFYHNHATIDVDRGNELNG